MSKTPRHRNPTGKDHAPFLGVGRKISPTTSEMVDLCLRLVAVFVEQPVLFQQQRPDLALVAQPFELMQLQPGARADDFRGQAAQGQRDEPQRNRTAFQQALTESVVGYDLLTIVADEDVTHGPSHSPEAV